MMGPQRDSLRVLNHPTLVVDGIYGVRDAVTQRSKGHGGLGVTPSEGSRDHQAAGQSGLRTTSLFAILLTSPLSSGYATRSSNQHLK